MSELDPTSFLPEDYLEQKAQRRTNVICAILTGIVMAAIGSAASLTEKVNHQAEERHAQVERRYVDAAKQIDQFRELANKERTMARQAELAASLLEKIPRSIVLAEVTNAVPAGVQLTEFTLDSRRVLSHALPSDPAKAAAAPAEPIVYDVTVSINGIAANDVQVADFIHRLGLSPLFKDVNLVISDELSKAGDTTDQSDKANLRKFEVDMGLNSDADVMSLNGRTTTNAAATAALPAN